MTDAFISYSRRNLDFVHRLDAALTAQGKTSWFDQKKEPLEGIPPGSKWWEEIKQGIETADNFLFVISPESVASPYCNAEIARALHHEKRIVTVLYRGAGGEGSTLQAIDAAIDAIPDHSELPPSVSTTITNLRSLTRRNWLEISRIQYVAFSDNGTFDLSLNQLIQGLDMDLAWIRMWSQVRQTARLWKETGDDSYLWSEMRLKPVREMTERRGQELTDIERDFIRSEAERLLAELDNIDTPHIRRSAIGERLSIIGDPRPGVGLRPDGLPDIVWCTVPGGKITLADKAKSTFNVQPFYIAKYPTTYVQFQAFLDDPDGWDQDQWWQGLEEKQQDQAYQRNKFASYPRDNVSWYQSVAFCRWLNAKLPTDALPTDLVPLSQGAGLAMRANWEFRLPAEWEWQQAATGGNPANDYPWGPDWDITRANTNEAGIGRTTAVGMYPQGIAPVGALDMSGNVWEWCLNENEEPTNTGTASDGRRVLRGGAWSHYHRHTLCRYRLFDRPAFRYVYGGFRVVCAPSTNLQTANQE